MPPICPPVFFRNKMISPKKRIFQVKITSHKPEWKSKKSFLEQDYSLSL